MTTIGKTNTWSNNMKTGIGNMAKWRCKRCQKNSLIFDDTDPLFEKRKERHEEGRHTRHETQNERYPDTEPHEINGGLGGLDYGPVEWEKVEENEQ